MNGSDPNTEVDCFNVPALPSDSRGNQVRHPWWAAVVTALLVTPVVTATAQAHEARPACRPKVAALALPTGLHAGESDKARVTLTCAPAARTTIAVRDDHTQLRTPASVRVGAHRRTATFRVTAVATRDSAYTAHVTARLGTSTKASPIRVTPGLSLVEIPVSSRPNAVGLDVLFTGPLPAGGATVKVTSDSPVVTVPRTLTFAGGSLGGSTAPFATKTVTHNTKITLTVTYGRTSLSATKVLVPPVDPTHPAATLSPQDPGIVYGTSFDMQYDLRLAGPAPAGGLQVTYAIVGDPVATVESTSDYIGEGDISSSTFLDFANVTSPHTVTLEAQIGESVFQLPLTIQPPVTAITVPATVVGGQDFTGTVTMAGPASVDTVLELSPSWGIVSTQPSVTIPAGQTSATFTGSTVPVEEDSQVFITGYYDGPSVGTDWMTVTP
jgi:hypothetical protein